MVLDQSSNLCHLHSGISVTCLFSLVPNFNTERPADIVNGPYATRLLPGKSYSVNNNTLDIQMMAVWSWHARCLFSGTEKPLMHT